MYRSRNPSWPVVPVLARRGGLGGLLDDWDTELPLEPLGGGRHRVGTPTSESRAARDTLVEGRVTRLVLDHEAYCRSGLR